MKLGLKLPDFRMTEFKGQINPLTKEGMKALGIVLAVIVLISGIVYGSQLVGEQKSSVLPATTEVEVTPQPTAAVTLTATPTMTPTATQSAVPTEAPVEFLPEAPIATVSPATSVIISPTEPYTLP